MDIEKNNVPAEKQVSKSNYVGIFNNDAKVSVLFIGNSITRHEPKPDIGWNNDWGMAASKKENDYVHVAVKLLEQKFGKVNYCIANCGEWEKAYFDEKIFSDWEKARDFNADIVVMRIGENLWCAKDYFDKFPIAPYYEKLVKYFCKNKDAKVIITDLFWENKLINDEIFKASKKNNWTLVHLSALGDKDENKALGMFKHEGICVHPNDTGMRKIAERIVKEI